MGHAIGRRLFEYEHAQGQGVSFEAQNRNAVRERPRDEATTVGDEIITF